MAKKRRRKEASAALLGKKTPETQTPGAKHCFRGAFVAIIGFLAAAGLLALFMEYVLPTINETGFAKGRDRDNGEKNEHKLPANHRQEACGSGRIYCPGRSPRWPLERESRRVVVKGPALDMEQE